MFIWPISTRLPCRDCYDIARCQALSDPAKVIVSPNVTVTGGIVALGKLNAIAAIPSPWSPGLRILPDYELLTGAKVPPVTPNIIDVRIVSQQTTADFPSSGQPANN